MAVAEFPPRPPETDKATDAVEPRPINYDEQWLAIRTECDEIAVHLMNVTMRVESLRSNSQQHSAVPDWPPTWVRVAWAKLA
jgi:hypothetical protein